MSTVENLESKAAIKKLQELATDTDICSFVTNLTQLPLASRPMSTQKVCDGGNIWFFSKNTSDKNHDIQKDNRVQLFYANRNSAEFLSVYGTAEIITDKQAIKDLWTPIAKAWFPDGVDDATITILKVTPLDAYYWDTKNNKLIALLKYAVSAVTGTQVDDGIQGKLKV